MSIFAHQPLFFGKTILALTLCSLLMWLDYKNPAFLQQAREFTHMSMQPVYQFSLVPDFAAHWANDTLKTKEVLRRENSKLRAELVQTRAKLQKQDYVLAQNSRLRGILSVTESDQFDLKLARVIGVDSNPTKQIIVLDQGTEDGVVVGQTVIDENGIMGQIINAYTHTSRLLLITDDQQSVSVMIKRTGQTAVVSGKGYPTQLSLDYIFKTSDVRLGDELISSGLGKRMPAGYHVGRISHIDTQQTDDNFIDIDVTPTANFVNNSYVLIMQEKTKNS